MKRWQSRFEETARGRRHDRTSEHYQDEAYAFFQNCYHLKDWLKNDPASAAAVTDVEQMISTSRALSICADLANGSKHLTLTTPRVDPNTKIGKRQFALTLGGGKPQISARYEVEAGPHRQDAFDLAADCVRDWEGYLRSKGLL